MTVRKRGRRRSTAWHDGHITQLCCRWDYLHNAWGEGTDRSPYVLGSEEATLEDMERAYTVLRDQVMEGYSDQHPGKRPWGWWQFESEEPPDHSLPEPEQLERMGLLTEKELTKLHKAAHGVLNEFHYPPFRREWGWWRFLSPHRRNWSISETEQLCSMRLELTKRERVLMEEKQDIAGFNKNSEWGFGIQDLSEDELKFLGIEL